MSQYFLESSLMCVVPLLLKFFFKILYDKSSGLEQLLVSNVMLQWKMIRKCTPNFIILNCYVSLKWTIIYDLFVNARYFRDGRCRILSHKIIVRSFRERPKNASWSINVPFRKIPFTGNAIICPRQLRT